MRINPVSSLHIQPINSRWQSWFVYWQNDIAVHWLPTLHNFVFNIGQAFAYMIKINSLQNHIVYNSCLNKASLAYRHFSSYSLFTRPDINSISNQARSNMGFSFGPFCHFSKGKENRCWGNAVACIAPSCCCARLSKQLAVGWH